MIVEIYANDVHTGEPLLSSTIYQIVKHEIGHVVNMLSGIEVGHFGRDDGAYQELADQSGNTIEAAALEAQARSPVGIPTTDPDTGPGANDFRSELPGVVATQAEEAGISVYVDGASSNAGMKFGFRSTRFNSRRCTAGC